MNEQVYIVYLEDLKNRVFKILRLCEEKNPHILTYLEDLATELKGLPKVYPEVLDTEVAWYVKVASIIFSFYEDYTIHELHDKEAIKRIRRQVFNMINTIEKELEMVR